MDQPNRIFRDRLAARQVAASSDSAGRKHRPDYWLLILSLALIVVGVIVVYSISPALGKAHGVSDNYYVTRQLIAIGIGAVAFSVTSRIPVGRLRQLCVPLMIVAGAATLLA